MNLYFPFGQQINSSWKISKEIGYVIFWEELAIQIYYYLKCHWYMDHTKKHLFKLYFGFHRE